MSTYDPLVWNQLKNKTIQQIARALEKDGWEKEESRGATQGYRHPDRPGNQNRVVLHIHPKQSKGPSVMKKILDDIGWTVEDMIRLGLIKAPKKRKKKKKGNDT